MSESMGAINDIKGKTFGKLTVIEQSGFKIYPSGNKKSMWLCECECGNRIVVVGGSLTSGNTTSCGCTRRQKVLTLNQTKTKRNEIEFYNNFLKVKMPNNTFSLVDLEDYDLIKDTTWVINNNGYVVSSSGRHGVGTLMHRVILDCPSEKVVDHINHNKTDNRKSNIRICTISENNCNRLTHKNNSSGKSGVIYRKNKNAWESYITKNHTTYYLGTFNNFEDAKKAREDAEMEVFTQFCCKVNKYESAN